jgi:hypothetical protein
VQRARPRQHTQLVTASVLITRWRPQESQQSDLRNHAAAEVIPSSNSGSTSPALPNQRDSPLENGLLLPDHSTFACAAAGMPKGASYTAALHSLLLRQ